METFAIWLLIYLPLMIFLPGLLSDRIMMPVRQAIALFLSLIALAWPVMRGIRWSQVRQDLGITWGSQPFLEPTLGFISYLNAWPFLIVGFGFMVVLGAVTVKAAPPQGDPFQPSPSIAHPLVAQLRTATAADILPYFLLMCVAAPVVEEIAFRGLLYRHLRDASRGWKIGGLFSVLAVSILFAAVHPQGVLAIPLLASLACGFALAREWRGTLIPAIIAHGLNNSMFLAFMIFALMR